MNLIKAITFLLCSTLLVGQTTPIRNPQIQGASGSIVSGATLTNSGTFTNSGTLGGAGTFDLSSGTVTMPATQILTNVTLNGTITFADNIKQTFNPGATYVGINVGAYAGVPSTLANGDLWYDSTANALKARINGATVSLGAGGGGSSNLDTLTDVNLTSLADVDFLRYDSGTSKWINRTPANVRTDLSLGAAALLGTSTGGNGTADNGKVLVFDTGGHFHATTSISVNNTSGTITAQFRPDSLLLNSTGSGSHTINGSATGARSHTLLDESGTLAHTATTLAGYGITDAQPLDTTLTALAALNNTKGALAQTGSDTFTRLQTPVNVKVYGAVGDARKVSDGVLTSNTTVESELANFTSADVGKVIWGTVYGSGSLSLPVGTIVSVTDENTVVVSDAAVATTTGVQLVIGTNDTAALVAASTAAKATSPPSALYIPSGGYIFDELIFDMQAAAGSTPVPAVVGDGSANTVFYASPSHDKVGSAMFYIADGNTIYSRLSGFAIDGGDYDFGAGSDYVIAIGSFLDTVMRDVRIEHVKGVTAGIWGYGYFQRLENVYVESVGGYGIASVSASSMELVNCISANCGTNSIYVSATDGAANTKSYFRMVGGWIDESPSGSLVITDADDVTFTSVRISGPASDFAADVDGTSIVSFIGCEITPWGTAGDRSGLTVASGGIVYLDNCRVDGAGTADSLTNAGTVYLSNTRVAGTGDDAINNTGAVYDGGNNTLGSVAGTAVVSGQNIAVSNITSGLGTNVATALGVNVGSAGAVVVNGGALGTPSSGTLTNATGLPPAGVTGTAAITGGANTFTAAQMIDGSADAIQMLVQGNGTQTSDILVVENSAGADRLKVAGDGAFTAGTGSLGVVWTLHGAADVTFSQVGGGGIQINNDWRTTGSVYIDSTSAGLTIYETSIYRDGASGIFAMKNGATAQYFRTYGDTTGSKYLQIGHDGTNAVISASSGTVSVTTGGLTVGSGGTAMAKVVSAAAAFDSANVVSLSETTTTFTVTGATYNATPNSTVEISWGAALETGIIVKQVWVSAADTVSVRLYNATGGDIDPASVNLRATVTNF